MVRKLIIVRKIEIARYGACHEYHHDDVLGRSAYAADWDRLEPHCAMAATVPLPPRARKSERRHVARYWNHAAIAIVR